MSVRAQASCIGVWHHFRALRFYAFLTWTLKLQLHIAVSCWSTAVATSMRPLVCLLADTPMLRCAPPSTDGLMRLSVDPAIRRSIDPSVFQPVGPVERPIHASVNPSIRPFVHCSIVRSADPSMRSTINGSISVMNVACENYPHLVCFP